MRLSSCTALFALAFLAGAAPGAALAQSKPAASESFAGRRDYDAIERDFIAKNPKLARRVGDKLYLRLHDGTETEIADSPKCGEVDDLMACNNHKTALLYFKDPGIYLLHVTLLKGARFLMVEDAIGETHVLAGAPIWSPDRQNFVTVSQSPDDPAALNGFEVWSFGAQVARRLSYQLPLSGKVEFDHWEDSDSFTLHVRHASRDQAEYQASWLDVRLSDDGVAVESRFEP
jgi:hypothetical protein